MSMTPDDPVLKAWGIRLTPVKNHISFYVISGEDRTVYIVRFLYGKRDRITILKQGFSLEWPWLPFHAGFPPSPAHRLPRCFHVRWQTHS